MPVARAGVALLDALLAVLLAGVGVPGVGVPGVGVPGVGVPRVDVPRVDVLRVRAVEALEAAGVNVDGALIRSVINCVVDPTHVFPIGQQPSLEQYSFPATQKFPEPSLQQ